MGKSRMGKSSSSGFVRKSSAKFKDLYDVLCGGKLMMELGTFSVHESLKRYEKDEVTAVSAVRVRLYLDPMKTKGFGFGHEFLVMELQTPENPVVIRAEKDFVSRVDVIRAEKDDAVMDHKNLKVGGVIKVTPIDDPVTFGKENKDRVKYDIDLQGYGKILMKDLFHILDDCNRCYSLWKHNCWKYAYETLKQLLEKFAGLADTSNDCKKNIREALDKLPRPYLPAEILVEAASLQAKVREQAEIMRNTADSVYTVKGLAGSSLFSNSMVSALSVYIAGGYLLEQLELMQKNHVVQRK